MIRVRELPCFCSSKSNCLAAKPSLALVVQTLFTSALRRVWPCRCDWQAQWAVLNGSAAGGDGLEQPGARRRGLRDRGW